MVSTRGNSNLIPASKPALARYQPPFKRYKPRDRGRRRSPIIDLSSRTGPSIQIPSPLTKPLHLRRQPWNHPQRPPACRDVRTRRFDSDGQWCTLPSPLAASSEIIWVYVGKASLKRPGTQAHLDGPDSQVRNKGETEVQTLEQDELSEDSDCQSHPAYRLARLENQMERKWIREKVEPWLQEVGRRQKDLVKMERWRQWPIEVTFNDERPIIQGNGQAKGAGGGRSREAETGCSAVFNTLDACKIW